MKVERKRGIGAVLASSLLAVAAHAQTADFDTLREDFYLWPVVDNGIQFSNLVDGLGQPAHFVVERADGTLAGMPGFTPRKVLGCNGYVPGPNAIFMGMRRFEFTRGSTANQASIGIIEQGSPAGNTITLQAFAGTQIVASHTVTITGGPGIHHYTLAVSGPSFQRLRVLGAGNQGFGTFFGLIDHVVIGGGGPGTALCFGDGTQMTNCPCLNSGAFGHGCYNSATYSGARLEASGTTSPDTVVLTSSGELPAAISIFVQGDSILPTPVLFGGGLRCVGGNLLPLYFEQALGGTASAPQVGSLSITAQSAALGDVIAPGSVRHYQTYYRDLNFEACSIPPGDTWNVSNGLSLTW